MSTQSEKLGRVCQSSGQARHPALAHLFWHKYAGRVFWYGVAQFPETPEALPDGASVSVTFEDGRAGHARFRGGKTGAGGYSEAAFVGVDQLKLPSALPPGPGSGPSSGPGSDGSDSVEFG